MEVDLSQAWHNTGGIMQSEDAAALLRRFGAKVTHGPSGGGLVRYQAHLNGQCLWWLSSSSGRIEFVNHKAPGGGFSNPGRLTHDAWVKAGPRIRLFVHVVCEKRWRVNGLDIRYGPTPHWTWSAPSDWGRGG